MEYQKFKKSPKLMLTRHTFDGRSGTQCPSTYMASSIRNGLEPSAMSPLLGRKQLMAQLVFMFLKYFYSNSVRLFGDF